MREPRTATPPRHARSVLDRHHHVIGAALHRRASSAELRWLLDTTPSVATDQALRYVGGAFYGSGGIASMAVAALVPTAHHRVLVAVIGLAAALVGLIVACWPGRFATAQRRCMNVTGTGLVTAVVLLCGRGPAADALYCLLAYVPVDSFFFFPWRWAVPFALWGLLASATLAFGAHVIGDVQWFISVIVGSAIAFSVGWLVLSAEDAEWDATTDTLSRRGLERELQRHCEQSEASSEGFSVARVSLREVTEGQVADAAADLLVRRLARLVQQEHVPGCRWARVRDHELAALWDGRNGLDEHLERVRRRAREIGEINIGVTDWRPGETANEMLAAASRGLNYSEAHHGALGRSGVVAAQVVELEHALATGQIVPYYQPIVCAGDGRALGGEALARWHHPERGLIAPDDFIPLAEQTGLIDQLGESILRRACVDARGWQSPHDGEPLRVNVNVSGMQLRDERFADVVVAALRDSGLEASRLVLEVTESTLYADDPTAHRTLSALRDHGVRIAIDDFGTGFSNLSRLAHLPVDILKLDRSFVAEVRSSPRVRSLLHGVAAMTHELGFVCLGEGVERPEEAELLRHLGVTEGQGWLWGRAEPLAEFERTVRRMGPIRRADPAHAR